MNEVQTANTLLEQLGALVSLLAALSVASERVVELIKGSFAGLVKENPDPVAESRRRRALHLISIGAGIFTAALVAPVVDMLPGLSVRSAFAYVALGLLVSGGSGLWNGILSYVLELKNIKRGLADALESVDVKVKLAEKAVRDGVV